MLPRWFRVVVACEVAGLAAFAVVGLHVAGQGVNAASNALRWLHPAHPTAAATPAPNVPIPSLLTAKPAMPQHALYGAALLTPSLLIRLNRDTGATAIGEYALLLNLEALAREQVTRLLAGISVPPSGN
jgi:hypothetical protein